MTAATALALGTVALFFAACGGASGPGVASLGSTTTSTTSPPAAQSGSKATDYLDGVKYAQCMRTHGVPNMPDPNSQGQFLTVGGKLNGQEVDQSSTQYAKANKACQHLLPNGGQITAAEYQQAIAQALKLVQCLRTQGIPNMPEPSTAGGGLTIHPPKGVDPNSPRFRKAMEACRSFSPAG